MSPEEMDSFVADVREHGDEFPIKNSGEWVDFASLYLVQSADPITSLRTALASAESRATEAEKALALLVADVADYPAWQRPCHALDVARSVLSRIAKEEKDNG